MLISIMNAVTEIELNTSNYLIILLQKVVASLRGWSSSHFPLVERYIKLVVRSNADYNNLRGID